MRKSACCGRLFALRWRESAFSKAESNVLTSRALYLAFSYIVRHLSQHTNTIIENSRSRCGAKSQY